MAVFPFLLIGQEASRVNAIDVPRGIYSLGAARDNASTPQDERLANIRNYDFVSAYTPRVFWSDIETNQGQHNFAIIDSAIQTFLRLDWD